jgi:hypothetical protein
VEAEAAVLQAPGESSVTCVNVRIRSHSGTRWA